MTWFFLGIVLLFGYAVNFPLMDGAPRYILWIVGMILLGIGDLKGAIKHSSNR